MSNLLVGFLLGAGLAAWVYSKIMRSSGGNTKNAAIVAGCAGVGAMVVMTLIMSAINK
ncbi:MAG: hypothetical protein ABI354_03505 [Candidatus Saccharimonadales bacterium]